MKPIIKFKLVCLLSLALLACKSNTGSYQENMMKYAEYITVSSADNEYSVSIANPWKKSTILHSYTLSNKRKTSYNYATLQNTIHTPLERVVVMTNSHCKLLVELGLEDKIAGICELEYIADSTINNRCREGIITDCGSALHPNIEMIIELNPDAILVSPFEDTGYGQLEKLGIPLIECADYMETSPLGRSEWSRFYGRLFNAEQVADSFFLAVEEKYNELCTFVNENINSRPTVMLDTKGGSAWYVAGGNSTIGKIIEDAGGKYLFSEYKNSGSIPLSFETVFEKAHDADIWLLKNSTTHDQTYESIVKEFASYSQFKPYKTKNIWVCDVYQVPYFENTSFHPENLLEEYISILHPELLTDYRQRWYHPMREAGE